MLRFSPRQPCLHARAEYYSCFSVLVVIQSLRLWSLCIDLVVCAIYTAIIVFVARIGVSLAVAVASPRPVASHTGILRFVVIRSSWPSLSQSASLLVTVSPFVVRSSGTFRSAASVCNSANPVCTRHSAVGVKHSIVHVRESSRHKHILFASFKLDVQAPIIPFFDGLLGAAPNLRRHCVLRPTRTRQIARLHGACE